MSWLDRLQKPKPPRKQVLYFAQDDLNGRYFAVVRLTWFCDGKIFRISEMALHNYDVNVMEQLISVVHEALHEGADVSALCIATAEELGLEPT
tara:strand:+ start:117 stop:395 length:279 start_codon:yes stop_codon:yes gene_type:complete